MIPVLISLLLLFAPVASAEDRVLQLSIGDATRKDRKIAVTLDAVIDAADGTLLTPSDLATRLKDTKILFVGELHNGLDYHHVQRRVIQELHRSGRQVLIGLEMYPYTAQEHLDHWSRNLLTESGFISLSKWYQHWGYRWDYYRDIFLYARDQAIPLIAINTPREVVSAVRRKGFENLTAEESRHLPPRIDTESPDHLTLFKAYFEDGDGIHSSMSEEQWKAMFDAQCTWDATMGFNAVRALEQRDKGDAIMVVLIGSGHVAYGLGIQRQAALWYQGKMASLIPLRIVDSSGRLVSSVQASYSDFVWGLPPQPHPVYPELGVSTGEVAESSHRKVLSVSRNSPGQAAGFEVGDLIVEMDGTPVPDKETLNRLLAGKEWGDTTMFKIERAGREVSLQVLFRRTVPEKVQ